MCTCCLTSQSFYIAVDWPNTFRAVCGPAAYSVLCAFSLIRLFVCVSGSDGALYAFSCSCRATRSVRDHGDTTVSGAWGAMQNPTTLANVQRLIHGPTIAADIQLQLNPTLLPLPLSQHLIWEWTAFLRTVITLKAHAVISVFITREQEAF